MAVEPWVITALISAAACVISIIGTSHALNKDRDAKDDAAAAELANIKTDLAVLANKMDTLSERVRKHNSVMERMYKLEAREDEIEHEIRDMKVGGTDD